MVRAINACSNSCTPPLPESSPWEEMGYTRLTYTICEEMNPDKALDLAEKCDDVAKLDDNGKSALHWACLYLSNNPEKMYELCCKLLWRKTPVNLQDKDGNTPLHYMMQFAPSFLWAKELLKDMLFLGADPEIPNDKNIKITEFILENCNLSMNDKLTLIESIINRYPTDTQHAENARHLGSLFNRKIFADVAYEDYAEALLFYDKEVLNQVWVPGKGPLLNCIISDEKLDDLQIINLASLLLKQDIDPNLKDNYDKTALLITLENRSLNFEQRKKLLIELVKHNADVNCIDNMGSGVIDRIWNLYRGIKAGNEIPVIFKLLYQEDVYQEYLLRELLINSFSLDGANSFLKNEFINFEGSHSYIPVGKLMADASTEFFTKLISELDGSDVPILWNKVLERCTESTSEVIHSMPSEITERLRQVLRKVPKLERLALKAQKLPLSTITKKISGIKPFAMMCDDKEHILGYFFLERQIFICNKGYASGLIQGVTIHNLAPLGNLNNLARSLKLGVDTEEVMKKYFPSRLKEDTSSDKTRMEYSLRQAPQKSGNCPIVNFNSLELGILYGLINMILDAKPAEELARALNRVNIERRKEEAIKLYLKLHSSPTTPMPFHDRIMLINLAFKQTSNPECDLDRFLAIKEWLKSNDEEGFTLLNSYILESFSRQTYLGEEDDIPITPADQSDEDDMDTSS